MRSPSTVSTPGGLQLTDYLGFLEKCRKTATYKLYHVPLEIDVTSVLRGKFWQGRYSLGHLHYFSKQSILMTLQDTGHEIVDYAYTEAALWSFWLRPTAKKMVLDIPRMVLSKLSISLAQRLLGGWSLLVLTK